MVKNHSRRQLNANDEINSVARPAASCGSGLAAINRTQGALGDRRT
jgi:hypothetical protein